ncbi:uncharacterized protein Pyn_07640 [Prunus yedoensis var. nudiflora]|uniref:Ankyrin repeat-containing protein n=1 Tax=Prunus yedoensis var. nudiflora TaxID=2094558 RepID=A0A314YLJ8_PRUYE|nr:uncharacterized protein Pyn_07640 [Prunus yedoensis var. nudiflora]
MAGIDVLKYAHSPVHKAIVMRDYASLRRILAGLPRLCNPAEIRTESASLAEEEKADAIASVIDRRDVPNRETPLHLAVKLGDQQLLKCLWLLERIGACRMNMDGVHSKKQFAIEKKQFP